MKTQIQARIEVQTKKEAKKILTDIGMDASTAINILFKQIVRTGTFPIDIRDINGFSYSKAEELRSSIKNAKSKDKEFESVKDLMDDLHS